MHENGAQHGSQLFAKLGFKELVGIRSNKETSCTSAWSFFCGGDMSKKALMVVSAIMAMVMVMINTDSAKASSQTEYIEPERVSMFNVGPLSVDLNGVATGLAPYGTSSYWASCPNSLGWQVYNVPIKASTVPTETRFIYTFSDEDLLKLKSSDEITVTVNCDDPHAYGSGWVDPNNGLYTPENTGIHVGISLVTWDNYIWQYKELYMGTNAFQGTRAYLAKIDPKTFYGDFSEVKGIAVWTMMNIPPTNGNSYIMISGTADMTIDVELKYDTDKLTNNMLNNIITPNVGDKESIQHIQSNVANKGDKAEQILNNSKVEKPTVPDEVLDPMDKVDDDALDSMGGMIGAVFVSPTLGTIAILTLLFALLGYILYGKRG